MEETIRSAILELDIFQPRAGTGFTVSAMILKSHVLQAYSEEEILEELLKMESEELVVCDHSESKSAVKEYWRSTLQGQIARQRMLVDQGHRSETLRAQNSHETVDLVLALIASHHISKLTYYPPTFSRDTLNIYLFDRTKGEIDPAVDLLIKQAYVSSFNSLWGLELSITGTGLQHYKNFTQKRLRLDDDQSVLDPVQSEFQQDERFSRLPIDPDLASNLNRRWSEAQSCTLAGIPLAGVILLGSILEGLFLAFFQRNLQAVMSSQAAPKDRSKNGGAAKSVKPLESWTLQEMIRVATDLKMIPRGITKHAHELRDTRNLVHPAKQVADAINVDDRLLRISFEVVEGVLEALLEYQPLKQN